MEESFRVTESGRHSALLLLPEEGFHTTVILDPGAGPGVDQHGDNVLVANTGSEWQDVFPWWYNVFIFLVSCSLWLQFQKLHFKVEDLLSYRSKWVLRSSSWSRGRWREASPRQRLGSPAAALSWCSGWPQQCGEESHLRMVGRRRVSHQLFHKAPFALKKKLCNNNLCH